MKTVEYVIPLGPDGRRRTRHVRAGGNVVEFVVQYEINVEGMWHAVVRYDTVHGFAHKDLISYTGSTRKERLPFGDLNLALTFAEKDLRENWLRYRDAFLREVETHDR